MYSPKIKDELIPDLYRIAKAKKIPMTRLVNNIVFEAIKNIKVEVQVIRETVEVPKEVFVIAENVQEKGDL